MKNLRIYSKVEVGGKKIPAKEAPAPLESKFVTTPIEIILGTELLSNHLSANKEVELNANTLPAEHKIDPKVTQIGFPTVISVLAQTPHNKRALPMATPTLMPILSKIRLAGVAIIGWTMGPRRTFKLIIILEYSNLFSTRLLILARACGGRELAASANTKMSRLKCL